MATSKKPSIKQLRLLAEDEPIYDVVKPPMKIYTKELLIDELKKIRSIGWIRSSRQGNDGGVGNTLEDLLGIQENNLPIPNAAEWELKCQRIGSTSLLTLFHMEPSPRALNFVPSIFLPLYGWSHQEAGKKYPLAEMSFRQTITGSGYSDRGFKVMVDRAQAKVLISFNSQSIDVRHFEWLTSVTRNVGLKELDPQPYWGFDDLRNKAGTKLLNCFYVRAERAKREDMEFFRYSEIKILRGFNLEGLLSGIEKGFVYVDFDARSGHNHGTKFRMRQDFLPMLYNEIIEI